MKKIIYVIALFLIACSLSSAPIKLDMDADTINVMISTLPINAPYVIPAGLTSTAGFVSVEKFFPNHSVMILMITVEQGHKSDMHKFLKKNGLDMPNEKRAYKRRYKK
jgi:hypothetical protein